MFNLLDTFRSAVHFLKSLKHFESLSLTFAVRRDFLWVDFNTETFRIGGPVGFIISHEIVMDVLWLRIMLRLSVELDGIEIGWDSTGFSFDDGPYEAEAYVKDRNGESMGIRVDENGGITQIHENEILKQKMAHPELYPDIFDIGEDTHELYAETASGIGDIPCAFDFTLFGRSIFVGENVFMAGDLGYPHEEICKRMLSVSAGIVEHYRDADVVLIGDGVQDNFHEELMVHFKGMIVERSGFLTACVEKVGV